MKFANDNARIPAKILQLWIVLQGTFRMTDIYGHTH